MSESKEISELKEKIKEHGVSPTSLMAVSAYYHERKKLGIFSLKRGEIQEKINEFQKVHNIGWISWGAVNSLMEKAPLINSENVSNYYEKGININEEVDISNHNMTAPTAEALRKSLTQPKSKKYSGYTSLDLSLVADEIEVFFSNQKFGWLSEAKPTIVVSKNTENVIIRCYTAKTLMRTWGNSKETAINVIVENKNGTIEFNCGFTGNKAVLSGSGIAGVLLTGGASLVGNAASAVKDGKLVNATLEFIDDMMKNQFSNNSNNPVIINQEIDIAEQIRKLSALKNDGILTDEEFNTKKKELLSKM